ncbi:hypothetical protein SDC9_15153 [bioreactor metagenome]|uniref:DUF2508 domain-containing protein n=1 Tax=bioreactor metagenome TaxID=1076179 RepID=A0A644TT37_9ZZZZ|nr:DUF2508 family protein [Negativicutes bacterium]
MQFHFNMAAVRNLVDNLLENKPPESTPLPKLPDVVEQARQEWFAAQSYYNTVTDHDLVDHAVYLMQATEKKYMYLLKQARQSGVNYSPYQHEEVRIEVYKETGK